MVIVSKAILRDYAEKNPDVTNAIFNWYDLVREANWKNFSEMKNIQLCRCCWKR
jgi:mRNA-degrading endonuclease HigB of HigAB toxin-antitoxin module